MSELKLRPPREQSKMARQARLYKGKGGAEEAGEKGKEPATVRGRYKGRDERCRASRHKPSGPPQIGGKPGATKAKGTLDLNCENWSIERVRP